MPIEKQTIYVVTCDRCYRYLFQKGSFSIEEAQKDGAMYGWIIGEKCLCRKCKEEEEFFDKLRKKKKQEEDIESEQAKDEEEFWVEVVVIVNGEDILEKVKSSELLSFLRKKALLDTNNTRVPENRWEMLDKYGALLDCNVSVRENNINDGDYLILTVSIKPG